MISKRKVAANQINRLKCLKRYLDFEEKRVLTENFIFQDFDYCSLVWVFSNNKSLAKRKKMQKVALEFLMSTYKSCFEVTLQMPG